jgi:hypothetical protein
MRDILSFGRRQLKKAGLNGPLKSSLRALLISTLFFFGGLELGLRLTGYSSPDLGMPDRDTGWALRPGAEGLIRRENKQGVYVRINSDGLRDREHSIPKPASTFRIAVLGDSLCEATEVPLEKTFWRILEREISTCAIRRERRIEVINFGVAGFSTAQQLITLQTKVWKYQPDIVLLAFTNSDVSENFRPLSGQPLAPYYHEEHGRLLLDDSFRALIRYECLRNARGLVAQHLRVAQLATRLLQRWRAHPASAAPDLDKLYLESSDPDWQAAWRVTDALLREIHRETNEHGAQLWITTTSNDIQVHPDARVREAFARGLGVDDLSYPDRRIRSLCSREGIPVIILAEEMTRYAEHNHVYLHGFEPALGHGHWNENGHRLAGELIAARFCQDLR